MLQHQSEGEIDGNIETACRPKPVFALVDCVSFYASCERLFRPDLNGRPTVIMSPNDSTVISCSIEAKAMGIAVGDAVKPLQARIDRGEIAAFSANFETYGDLSRRVMKTLRSFRVPVEEYSIDEGWMDLSNVPESKRYAYGCRIRNRVKAVTGLPVRVGIGLTKTVSKLANKMAQRWPEPSTATGVLDLCDPKRLRAALADASTQEVWGIGPAYDTRLRKHGVTTALQLADTPAWWVKHHLDADGGRTAWELVGNLVLKLEPVPPPPQSVRKSSVFGAPVTQLPDLLSAVTDYVNTTCARLRRRGVVARSVSVTLWLSHPKTRKSYSRTVMEVVRVPTREPLILARLARRLLKRIFLEGYKYTRAGVVLDELILPHDVQPSLFDSPGVDSTEAKAARLTKAMQNINTRFGKRTIYSGAEGLTQGWHARHDRLSPSYTTDIRHLATACAEDVAYEEVL